MTVWHKRTPNVWNLGQEGTDDYRGYVARVRDHREEWYIYLWDAKAGVHHWFYHSDTEETARQILAVHTGVERSGYLCEVYVGAESGHCANDAVVVHFTDDGNGGHARVILCAQHRKTLQYWTRLPLPDYVARYGLTDVLAVPGRRRGPSRDGEQSYVVMPDNERQGPWLRSVLNLALEPTSDPVFNGTDSVNAANFLRHARNLPDAGPWALTRVELRTLVIALRRQEFRRSRLDDVDQAAIRELIRETYSAATGVTAF
ncbi:hypothetical protein ACIRBX_12085 [Kitasatospora sp. NPDC096147]|uniref:hypothetical protein n=1 Tax=Kitasatospora sp. NPDC096147 TaxID=3364093 RepID=UPI0037FE49CD